MMIDPPIDKLIKKAECRYALVLAVTARAKQLITQEASYLQSSGQKALTLACKEIYNDEVIIKRG